MDNFTAAQLCVIEEALEAFNTALHKQGRTTDNSPKLRASLRLLEEAQTTLYAREVANRANRGPQ